MAENNEYEKVSGVMREYGDARYECGLEQGRKEGSEFERARISASWLERTTETLKRIKKDCKLSEEVWMTVVSGCPDDALLPKLRQAVGI